MMNGEIAVECASWNSLDGNDKDQLRLEWWKSMMQNFLSLTRNFPRVGSIMIICAFGTQLHIQCVVVACVKCDLFTCIACAYK